MSDRDIDSSSENVLSDWARGAVEDDPVSDPAAPDLDPEDPSPAWGTADGPGEEESSESALEALVEPEPGEPEPESELADTVEEAELEEVEGAPFPVELSHEHAAGDLHIPDGYAVLEGVPEGGRRAVGVVVSRFNGNVTTRLLDRALEELSAAGVRQEAITVMVVPGAFELPLAATALAKTRRFACIVALGCVIRGDTPHFDYVASEAASGLQLAALETGVPVSFGVLTLDRVEQADPRIEKGADAVRSALEMADLFAHLRVAASR
jgi:6,7-dimethyl-8-ribityllumazine synthase